MGLYVFLKFITILLYEFLCFLKRRNALSGAHAHALDGRDGAGEMTAFDGLKALYNCRREGSVEDVTRTVGIHHLGGVDGIGGDLVAVIADAAALSLGDDHDLGRIKLIKLFRRGFGGAEGR